MKLITKKLFLCLVALGIGLSGMAQMKSLPLEPGVRTGKLDNGMTYFIKKNAKPEKTADFYIAHAVGSLQEDQDQHGLAHFLEHMAFNGTKRFPGKSLFTFLEHEGAAFGRNINAYTYYDETVYNLTAIPLSRPTMIDSCLLVLHDWSSYISLLGKEIDGERGVIHEEWRTRMAGGRRALIKTNAILYDDSKYGKRTVIGDLDVIDNFKHERIRDLYNDWYRPDLQAVIVVGDFDVDVVEKKVKALFSKIPKRENAKPRVVHQIPDNDKLKVAVVTDPEAQNTRVTFYIKQKRAPKEMRNSAPYLVEQYMRSLYGKMISDRFSEIVQKPNAPFIVGFSGVQNLFLPTDAIVFGALAKDNGSAQALTAVMREAERVKRHGFTATEFERAKEDLFIGLEKAVKEKDKQHHGNVVTGYVRHFLENTPNPGAEAEMKLAKQVLPNLPVQAFNMWLKKMFTENNQMVSITGPEKEGVSYPTEAEIAKILEDASKEDVKAYVDNVITEPLMAEAPKGGKVVSESKNDLYGTTEWTLSNGVKVVIKTTDFKEDEIRMSAFSDGGKSLINTADLQSADFATTLTGVSGVSKFDQMALNKLLAGKNVKLSPYIGNYSEGFSGSSTVKDFETMLQLFYLNMVKPRFDKDAFTSILQRYKDYLVNMAKDPNANFRDSISVVMNQRSPRRPLFNADAIDKISYEKAKEVYESRIPNAKDMTVVMVGNIDMDKMKPLIESYIGALPVKSSEKWVDDAVRYPKKSSVKAFDIKMETKKASIMTSYVNKFKYNIHNKIYLRALSHILDLRYTESVREESGASYGVRTSPSLKQIPHQEFALNISFDTDPAKAAEMKKIIQAEIDKILKNGPTEEDLKKTKEYFMKSFEKNQKENGYWMSIISNLYDEGIDPLKKDAYKTTIEKMTVKSCKKTFKKLLKKAKKIEVSMNPKQ